MSRPLCVMLVAAEASGDERGAQLAQALREQLGEAVRFVGVGGAKMAGQGIVSPFDIAQLSILGLFEGLRAYPRVLRRVADTVRLAQAERPDVVVLIDSWGFTLRVAKALRRLPSPPLLVKYVGPQVWASRPGRAKVLAQSVDHLLAINAFDAPYFEREGLATTFVGNAALAKDFSKADPARLRAAIGAKDGERILLVLPGSRPSEVARLAPVFEQAVARLKAGRPDLHVVVPVAQTVAAQVREWVDRWPVTGHVIDDEALKTDAMAAADAALACSGTVTTELALAGAPMVVAYKLGAATHSVLKHLIRTPYITLFNIAAGRFIAPELIQDRCTPQALALAVGRLLDDPAAARRQAQEQTAALDRMGRGGPDPSKTAAQTVIDLLARRAG